MLNRDTAAVVASVVMHEEVAHNHHHIIQSNHWWDCTCPRVLRGHRHTVLEGELLTRLRRRQMEWQDAVTNRSRTGTRWGFKQDAVPRFTGQFWVNKDWFYCSTGTFYWENWVKNQQETVWLDSFTWFPTRASVTASHADGAMLTLARRVRSSSI